MRCRNHLASSVLLLAAASCSSSSTSSTARDGGTPETSTTSHDASKPKDDAKASDAHKADAPTHPPDAGRDATTDAASEGGGSGLTCGQLLSCDMPCSTSACTNACYATATGTAQGIFNAFSSCIAAACPSAAGDVCADAGGSACSMCNTQAATGTCGSLLITCETDESTGPADPDGGSAHYDAGLADAGSELNCGGLVSCQGACGDAGASCASACTSRSTATAQALAAKLATCLAKLCPTTDGGACVTQSGACTGCQNQAEFDPQECGDDFNTCESDTSNAPDAGAVPVAIQGGPIVTLATGLDQPQVVIVQNGFVYYSQVSSMGPVSRVALGDAGAAPTNVNPSQPFPMGLAVDANNVYAWNSGTFSGSTTVNEDDGSVVQIPLNGGAPITLASSIEAAYAAPYLNAVAVSGGHVYWVAGAVGSDGAIMTTPVGASSPTAVYSNQPFPEAVVTDGTNLYWANWGTYSSSGAYNNDGAVLQGPIGGGTVTTLASSLSAPTALAVDSHHVYWTNTGRLGADNFPAPGTGSVMQADIGGGNLVTLASNQAIPLGITVGGNTVYWNDYTLSAPGTIESIAVGGGTLAPVATGLSNPFGITVSGKLLVWSDSPPTQAGSGKILALTLP